MNKVIVNVVKITGANSYGISVGSFRARDSNELFYTNNYLNLLLHEFLDYKALDKRDRSCHQSILWKLFQECQLAAN